MMGFNCELKFDLELACTYQWNKNEIDLYRMGGKQKKMRANKHCRETYEKNV